MLFGQELLLSAQADKCLVFPTGNTEYAILDSPITLPIAGATLAVWFNRDFDNDGKRFIFGNTTSATKNYLNYDNATVIAETDNAGGADYWTLINPSADLRNYWHLMVITAIGGGIVHTYLDDMITPTDTETGVSDPITIDQIGRGGSANTQCWKGKLKTAALSITGAISEAERIALFNNADPLTISAFTNIWKMNEGSGSIIKDCVGGIDGTITNAKWGDV